MSRRTTLIDILHRFLFVCLFFASSVLAEPLPAQIKSALEQAGIPDTHIGLIIQPLDTPTPQLAWGAERSFNPASVMKLLTTLAALDGLNPAYTWKTRILYEGEIRNGVLQGNLIIQGSGDPSLSLERFWLLLRELRNRGIQVIQGDVVLDQSYYQIEAIDPGQFDQLPLKPYNAPPAALMVSQNSLAVRLRPDERHVSASLEPPVPGMILNNQLQLADRPCNGWQDAISSIVDNARLQLQGSYPAACGDKTLWLNLLSPNETVAGIFASLWQELGGQVKGRIRGGAVPPSAKLLFDFDSLPLALIARDINTYSNNVMAKMLFLNLGAVRYGAPATWEKGERAIRAWLEEKGLEMPELVMENGAGLSRIARISANSLSKLLQWAPQSPGFFAFAASLPMLGLNGTLKSRLNGSPHIGQAWLKTGSLNGVRNLAGYLLDQHGRRNILILLINHANAENGAKLQESAILEAIKPSSY